MEKKKQSSFTLHGSFLKLSEFRPIAALTVEIKNWPIELFGRKIGHLATMIIVQLFLL